MLSLATPNLVEGAGPLLILAVIILAGILFGAVAARFRLPRITGQILAGVVFGKAGLELFEEEALHELQPLTHFALGLMAIAVGAHLNLRRLRNAGKRLVLLLVAESTVTPLIVFSAIYFLTDTGWELSALFATCAIATAPATIVALVREARARGVFVKTLVAAVALNNMACIFLFEVARFVARSGGGEGNLVQAIAEPGQQLLIAMSIGGGVAVAMELFARYTAKNERLSTAAMVSLVLTSGAADYFDVSPLLACLFLGFVQVNITRERDNVVDSMFDDFRPAILAIFFTLAGMHLSLENAELAGALALLFFFARFGGKVLAARLAMGLAHATDNVKRNLGIALVPQAGLAVALVILIQDDPAFVDVAEIFSSVVLTVVTVNEVAGPIFTRYALGRAGEVGKDRLRLMDFLEEENIVTDFVASTKHEAIEKLVDMMITSHHMEADERKALLSSVLEREEQASTCLGGGLAVPHGILAPGNSMAGVMALSRTGLDFDTPDGRPVHCMVLLGTAPDERDRHLQVLATLARNIGTDPVFQAQLFNAKSPAHASELLQGDDSEDFNYFLAADET